ncbi:ubiquitin carboxyl-terminal hydrolase 37-like isoform X1 [Centropristis striata]|uniref:ubiquitin carboxyl-terminal hydrolase 37-like isoform X1 n=1 Tax=Centropristis striata TaxID=184440 RepID=UPI0027E1A606|nr:ubiquitin carboxyl-terminal hydrolase 37-like isoform X1 [Centropristis striata]
MFDRKPKKIQIAPEKVEGDQSFNGRVNVSEAPATRTSAESRTGRTPWWSRLFRRSQNEDTSPPETLKEPTKKSSSFWRLFSCCRRKSRVAPSVEDEDQQQLLQPDGSVQADEVVEFKGLTEEEENELEETKKEDEKAAPTVPQQTDFASLLEDAVVKVLCQKQTQQNQNRPVKTEAGTRQPISSTQVDKVVECKELSKEEKDVLKEDKKEDRKAAATVPQQPESGDKVTKVVHQKATVIRPWSLRVQHISWLGFPNPLNNCYMNSSLQSLITLAGFIRDVNYQEDAWSLIPEAELISRFMNIVRCHGSRDGHHKLRALDVFKRTVSILAPEFADNGQKDAHEFITTVLGQMRTLAAPLQEVAAFVGNSYCCPVEKNLVFKMQNTRTCKRCGAQSIREEEFTNLSLDLLPGASVQVMIQNYQKETQLEFKCECGGKTSGQRSTFLTLPKVLMLQIKRFTFTPCYQLVKLQDPVDLFRELMVTSTQAEGLYSLVSVISHLGTRGNSGHYVSDGVHPDQDMGGAGDRWLHYNDAQVTETTRRAVCEQRQRTAYILFYQRRVRGRLRQTHHTNMLLVPHGAH